MRWRRWTRSTDRWQFSGRALRRRWPGWRAQASSKSGAVKGAREGAFDTRVQRGVRRERDGEAREQMEAFVQSVQPVRRGRTIWRRGNAI